MTDKRPVGSPSKYRPEYCEALVKMMARGKSATSFAASIGVSRSTIQNWTKEHPEFLVAVERGKAAAASWWEDRIIDIAQNGGGNATCAIFGVKNMAPDDWKDKQEVDHRSGDGSMSPRGISDFYAEKDAK